MLLDGEGSLVERLPAVQRAGVIDYVDFLQGVAKSVVFALLVAGIGLWGWGCSGVDFVLLAVMYTATGLGITVGYHRLFAHRSFQAPQIVRVLTALAGTATFENSVLTWASEHRYHHKYVDQDGFPYDPYSIKQGFFHAHVGCTHYYGWTDVRRPTYPPRTSGLHVQT